MTTPLIGRVYVRRNNWMTGYFMVMRKGLTTITLSPLFWCDEVVYQKISREYFKKEMTRFNPDRLPTRVYNRYQREYRRRIRIIDED